VQQETYASVPTVNAGTARRTKRIGHDWHDLLVCSDDAYDLVALKLR
jgi:hypothetical protein